MTASRFERRDHPREPVGGSSVRAPVAAPPPVPAPPAAPPAAPPPPELESPAAAPDHDPSPLSQVLARAIAARRTPDAVLMRAEGDGTAVLEPEEEVGPSSEERALLMTTFGLTDPARLDTLLTAADDDVAGLLRLGRRLAAKGWGVALALRLLRRVGAGQAANLVAAARFPERLPQLLWYVPNAELLRTLLIFEDEHDATWLVRVCSPVPLREQQMLPVVLERLPHAAAPALLALERPSVLLGLLPLVVGPAALVTILPRVPDRALLKRCLALEPRAAVLAPLCSQMSVDRDDLPRLLELVVDRGLLLRLVTAERDGRRLVELLRLAGDPAILERLLRDVRNRVRLENALNAVAAELGLGRAAAAAVEVLVQANLLAVVADQARLKRVLSVIGRTEGLNYDADAMGELLDEAAEFDYHWDFGMAAIENARAEGARLVEEERIRLDALEVDAIEAAITKRKDEATDALNKKVAKKLDLYGNAGDEARKARLDKQRELAAADIEALKAATARKLEEFAEGAAARAMRDRKQEYLSYFSDVGHDPDALRLLDVAGGDFAVARGLHAATVATPGLRALALDKRLGRAALERLIALPAPAIAAAVGTLGDATLRAYTASQHTTALLGVLIAGAIPAATITDLATHLGALASEASSAAQHPAFVALLGVFDATQLAHLRDLTPGAGKLTYLNGLRTRCTDYQALESALRLARRAKWMQANIDAAIVPGAGAHNSAALRTLICNALYAEHNRNAGDAAFRRWVERVSLLIDIGHCTITRTTADYLPDIPGLGPTIESTVTVAPYGGTFVLHTHPGAKDTGVNTSKYHIKPVRGNKSTPRVYRESIPDALGDLLPNLKTMYSEAKYG